MHRSASDPSFIDILITDHAGRNDQLDRVDQMIDWPKVAKKVNGLYASPEGRPAYPLATMVKIIVLQQWYIGLEKNAAEAMFKILAYNLRRVDRLCAERAALALA